MDETAHSLRYLGFSSKNYNNEIGKMMQSINAVNPRDGMLRIHVHTYKTKLNYRNMGGTNIVSEIWNPYKVKKYIVTP